MIIFDTETTGLPQPTVAGLDAQPHIIEFAAIKIDVRDMSIIGEIEFMCKPPIAKLDPVITKITGITDEKLADKLAFSAHFEELAELFVGESEGTAHNAPFDFTLMEFEMARMNKSTKFPWPIRRCCTVEATHHIKNRRMKMTELYEHALGKPLVQTHRAMDDVMALYEIVCWMHREGMPL
jgi:DNA polymerase III epsilon subunit-like protein